MDFAPIIEKLFGNQAFSTAVLLVAAIAVRQFTDRYLRSKAQIDSDQRRRILSNVKNALVVVVVIGLFFIWAPALRSFALSLTAFAVAIIIATKEVILCFSGAVVKMTTGSMRVGNWIEINGLRGEVIDQDLMSTTIQELGHGASMYRFTGKTVVLPNSVFLASPVKNERFFKRYVVHDITMTIDVIHDAEAVAAAMAEVARAETAAVADVTKRYRSVIEARAGIELPDINPKSYLETTSEGHVKITLSCFLPTGMAMEIQRKAIAAGLALVRQNAPSPSPAPQPH